MSDRKMRIKDEMAEPHHCRGSVPQDDSLLLDNHVYVGYYDREIFRTKDGEFAVGVVHNPDVDHHKLLRNIPIKGSYPKVDEGTKVSVSGTWVNDPKYGKQMKVSTFHLFLDDSYSDGLRAFFTFIAEDVGTITATALVEMFGETLGDIIENHPERLLEVPGVGEKRAEGITAAWAKHEKLRDLYVGLGSLGVESGVIRRIANRFDRQGKTAADVLSVIMDNPYNLINLGDISFSDADAIAYRMGVEEDDHRRIAAGVGKVSEQLFRQYGHCAIPGRLLLSELRKLLLIDSMPIRRAVRTLANDKEFLIYRIGDEQFIVTHRMDTIEDMVADWVTQEGTGGPINLSRERESYVSQVEREFNLTAEQTAAVRGAVGRKVSVVTGGPGTGKTYLLKGITRVCRLANLSLALAAPTGKAAKRMSEMSGMEASTLHRLFGLSTDGVDFDSGDLEPMDVLIIDESSMMDVELLFRVLCKLPGHTHVVLVGDVDQLPSVGPGRVLSDVIDCGVVHTTRLTHIFRQSALSSIIDNAHRINNGKSPQFHEREGIVRDMFFRSAETTEQVLFTLRDTIEYLRGDGYNPIEDVQVLAPMHGGDVGVQALNLHLQSTLNPDGTWLTESGQGAFYSGDRVVHTRNNYQLQVFNGECGIVIDPVEYLGRAEIVADGILLGVQYPDHSGIVWYTEEDLEQLKLAYCLTVHKFQGSETPVVIVITHSAHTFMLNRTLIYTAVTRGKKQVVLIGSNQALDRGVRSLSGSSRVTLLRERINREI